MGKTGVKCDAKDGDWNVRLLLLVPAWSIGNTPTN